jgi:hypothetical protein
MRFWQSISTFISFYADDSANGLMEDEMVTREVSDIREALVLERSKNNGSWLDLVRTPSNRRRTAVVIMLASATQFVGNGVVQYPFLSSTSLKSPHCHFASRCSPSS